MLGSHQDQAVQQLTVRNAIAHRPINTNFLDGLNRGLNTWPLNVNLPESTATEITMIDKTGVVGSGADTRPSNTALAPRIIAY